MNKIKQMLFLVVGIIVTSVSLQATTIFARQYDMQCNACHVGVPPTLNSTGMTFLRNGFRFSKDDATTLQQALKEENALIPVNIFLGAGYKNAEMTIQAKNPQTGKPMTVVKKSNIWNPTAVFIVAGSLTENLSTFVGGQYAYMETDPNSDDRSMELLDKKIYLQYNLDEAKHVARAGVISPYTQLGNVVKSSENAGLNGSPDIFITPIAMANMKSIRGIEYSYLTDNGFTFLIAGGVLDNANDETNFMGAVSYFNNSDFRIALIVNQINETDSTSDKQFYTPSDYILGERTTAMIPIEYHLGYGYLNAAAVYETNDRKNTDDYYGFETTFTMPVLGNGKVYATYTTDNDSKQGYGLGGSYLIHDNLLLGFSLAKFETANADFEALGASIRLVF